LNILQATHVVTMLLEDILWKGFSKGVSDLILGFYWEYLYKPISYVFAKVMVTYVEVLGTRAKLWKPGKFQCGFIAEPKRNNLVSRE
jgi:hypothetical protein